MTSLDHAEVKQPSGLISLLKGLRNSKTDWSAYAASYDMLLEHNPAYQELLEDFEQALSKIDAPRVIYDIGGGTGNYSRIAARNYPESCVYLVEPDHGMSARAREKLTAYGNVVYVESSLQEFEAPAEADLVICAHALYAMQDPQSRLADLRKLLRPGGILFLVDIGRPLDVSDWRSFLFSHLTKEVGIAKALRIFWNGREIAKQNKAIFKAQKDGQYWTHSGAEISSAVKAAGFEVIAQKTAYRGYSDLLLCSAAS